MSNEDSYTSRVTKCFELLGELLTKYPRSIDEVEENLVKDLEYYKDLASYVPQEKLEVKSIICKVSPPVVRHPIVMIGGRGNEYYFDNEDEVSPLALNLED